MVLTDLEIVAKLMSGCKRKKADLRHITAGRKNSPKASELASTLEPFFALTRRWHPCALGDSLNDDILPLQAASPSPAICMTKRRERMGQRDVT
jgi:hypothetical protein